MVWNLKPNNVGSYAYYGYTLHLIAFFTTQVHSDALLRHDGLSVLSYDTKGSTDFSGFDYLLDRLYHATNPASSTTISASQSTH